MLVKFVYKIFPVICVCVSSSAWAVCSANLDLTSSSARFVMLDADLVVDEKTGLMWKRCVEGYSWVGNQCLADGNEVLFSWQDALLASQQSYKDYSDWRLPNKNELNSIVERACTEPAINNEIFPNTPSETFWSSTPNAFNTEFAWAITFSEGAHISTRRNNSHAIRLVRDY